MSGTTSRSMVTASDLPRLSSRSAPFSSTSGSEIGCSLLSAIAFWYASVSTRRRTSSRIAAPKRFSISAAGAVPRRKPGICTSPRAFA